MSNIARNLKLAFIVAALPWVVYLADMLMPMELRWLGIHPRQTMGLPGIVLSPLLHADLNHILANTGGLFTMSFLALTYEPRRFFSALAFIVVAGGSLVWVFGSGGSVHIGASGVVFGLLGYLLSLGMFHKSLKAIIASALVFFLYGGVLLSLLVYQPGISWSSHFFGFLAGVLAAWIFKK